MYGVAAMWLIFALMSSWTGVPNKVAGECIYILYISLSEVYKYNINKSRHYKLTTRRRRRKVEGSVSMMLGVKQHRTEPSRCPRKISKHHWAAEYIPREGQALIRWFEAHLMCVFVWECVCVRVCVGPVTGCVCFVRFSWEVYYLSVASWHSGIPGSVFSMSSYWDSIKVSQLWFCPRIPGSDPSHRRETANQRGTPADSRAALADVKR